MPDLDWNRRKWNEGHDWSRSGDEWSDGWGGPDMQWFGSILPRLHRYLPASAVLEIGPGFGRWTEFLLPHADRLVGVDLSDVCVDACRRRFGDHGGVEFHVGDGIGLPMVDDGSVDLVFSFDSLVHAEQDVMASYCAEISRVLTPSGVAFLHHSNLGAHRAYFARVLAAKRRLGHTREESAGPAASDPSRLRRFVPVDSDRSRALSVDADVVASLAGIEGLRVLSQETINWGTRRTIDCITVLGSGEVPWPSVSRVDNPHFMAEADRLQHLGGLYGDR